MATDTVTLYVPVDDGAVMVILNPRNDGGSGLEWTARYGHIVAQRYEIAAVLDSYQYLLSGHITGKEAARRLRLMRRAYRAAQ